VIETEGQGQDVVSLTTILNWWQFTSCIFIDVSSSCCDVA